MKKVQFQLSSVARDMEYKSLPGGRKKVRMKAKLLAGKVGDEVITVWEMARKDVE